MPEYAELHASAHAVLRAADGHRFLSVEVRDVVAAEAPATLLVRAVPGVDGTCEKETVDAMTREFASSGAGQRLLKAMAKKNKGEEQPVAGRPLAGSEIFGSEGVFLSAAHRGKEVAVVLSRDKALDGYCPTCFAALGMDARGVPRCRVHEVAMRKTKARKDGRVFFACARKENKCDSFVWADECPKKLENEQQAYEVASSANQKFPEDMVVVTFRRGMRGKFELLDGKKVASSAHVIFWRDDGKALVFSDRRVRRSEKAIYNLGGFSVDRSPDPLWENDAWRSLFTPVALSDSCFDGAICEVMLDQRYFNGVGNYLRAEILDFAHIRPFDIAREVLSVAESRETLLKATVTILKRSILAHRSKKRIQLAVFGMRFAKKELDAHGRTVWFRGDRGALPSPEILDTPWNRVVFGGIPPSTPREDVLAFFQQFGDLQNFWLNPQSGYGAARYATIQQATAAVDAARLTPLHFGSRLRLSYSRRLRNHARHKFKSPPLLPEEPNEAIHEEEDPPTSTDEDIGNDGDDGDSSGEEEGDAAAKGGKHDKGKKRRGPSEKGQKRPSKPRR